MKPNRVTRLQLPSCKIGDSKHDRVSGQDAAVVGVKFGEGGQELILLKLRDGSEVLRKLCDVAGGLSNSHDKKPRNRAELEGVN
jgi:hypothetical protein